MNNKSKIFIGIILILLIIAGLIGIGFHTMSIEDRYGDFQVIYFEASDNDIIVMKNKKEGIIKYGIIDKSWDRISIFDLQNHNKQGLHLWINSETYTYNDFEFTIYKGLKDWIKPTQFLIETFIEKQLLVPKFKSK
jgi:hypothetical protein